MHVQKKEAYHFIIEMTGLYEKKQKSCFIAFNQAYRIYFYFHLLLLYLVATFNPDQKEL